MTPTIFAERNKEAGWVLSYLHDSGYRVTHQYYGYTLRQATQLFREKIKQPKEN